MSKESPTTQEFLLEHLLRIVEGVAYSEDDDGREIWSFGFGEDALISMNGYRGIPSPNEKLDRENAKKNADLSLFCASLGVEVRDHMGVPKRLAALRSELLSKKRQRFVETLKEVSTRTIEIGYAYEVLSKLKDMVERGREAVQEMHMLPKVPRWVDKYMSEAASCYRFGFDLACITLCRSALEEALKDRLIEAFGPEAIEQCEEGKGKSERGLKELINMAALYDLLDPQFQQSAHKIRMAGNDCAHGKLAGKQVRSTASDALTNSRLIIQMMFTENNKDSSGP